MKIMTIPCILGAITAPQINHYDYVRRPDGHVVVLCAGPPPQSEWEAQQQRKFCRLLEEETNKAREGKTP